MLHGSQRNTHLKLSIDSQHDPQFGLTLILNLTLNGILNLVFNSILKLGANLILNLTSYLIPI